MDPAEKTKFNYLDSVQKYVIDELTFNEVAVSERKKRKLEVFTTFKEAGFKVPDNHDVQQTINIRSDLPNLSKTPNQVLKFIIHKQQEIIQRWIDKLVDLNIRIDLSPINECDECNKFAGDEDTNLCEECSKQFCHYCNEDHDCREKNCVDCRYKMGEGDFTTCGHCFKMSCIDCQKTCTNCTFHACKKCLEKHIEQCISCHLCGSVTKKDFTCECKACNKRFCAKRFSSAKCYRSCSCIACSDDFEDSSNDDIGKIFCLPCYKLHITYINKRCKN